MTHLHISVPAITRGMLARTHELKMTAFRASLHAPSSLVCNAAESDNSSEDELPFDENIPLAGYKEQDEEEDEEAVGGFLNRWLDPSDFLITHENLVA